MMNTSYQNSQPGNPLNSAKNGVMPDSLKYVHKESAVPAYSETQIFIPDNGSSFSPSLSPTINIPLRTPPNSFIDMSQSYLMVSISNNSTVAGVFDAANLNRNLYFDNGNVSSIIKSLKILSGGTTISEISNKYHTLASLLLANNTSDDYQRCQSILGGTSEYDLLTAAGTATAGVATDLCSSNNFIGSGGSNAPTGSTDTSRTFIIPLISGFLNGSKLLPSHFTQNAFITLQLSLADGKEAFITRNQTGKTNANTVLDYSVTGVKFYAKTVYLNDSSVMDRLVGTMLSEGKLSMCVPEWSCVSIPFTIGPSVSINIPARYQVLKNIICCIVPQSTDIFDCGTQSSKYGLTSYQFVIGGRTLQKIDTKAFAPQGYAEYLKCFNTLNNINISSNASASIWAQNNHNANISATNFPKRSSFAIAQNVENFPHSDALESGLNLQSLALNLTLNLEFDGVFNTQNFTMCCFFNFDTIYELYGDSTWIVKA